MLFNTTSWPGIAVRRTASLPLAYVPAIDVLLFDNKDVDARHKAGYDKQRRPWQNRGLRLYGNATDKKSARIEFDDQMRLHLYRERHVGQVRDTRELRRHLGMIDFEEVGDVALGELVRFQNDGELL